MNVWLLSVLICVLLFALSINSAFSIRQRKRAWLSGWFKKLTTRCFHNGIYYNKGDTFDKTYDWQTNTCSALRCGFLGNIRNVIEDNCSPPTTHTAPPTTPPTPTTTPPFGCFYNHKFYPPGTKISSGKTGNWCYFVECNSYGEVIHGDDFNCGKTTRPTTMPPTTRPPGCYYNGKYYPLGTEISRGRSGTWCYFTRCDRSGHVISGDNFNCTKKPRTTSPPPATQPAIAADRSLELFKKELKDLLRKINKRK
ncbi:uncharacterized protein LOC132715875 [Ruditapes philippinarum]|uniref:uncharacterized protein LOC132715875 n=1 Tax=Ruditapes philippinarum TaxID=129788 RepID=UPI00295BC0F2|nr:uncharacterized protein LOC132715875 [Ruditapes philippinarum]